MKSYNGFSPDERNYGQKLINKAISDGRLKPAYMVKCSICGLNKGIRHYHCEDYSPKNIVDNVIPLCFKCHMALHKNKHKWETYEEYVEKLSNIRLQKPVYNKYYTKKFEENLRKKKNIKDVQTKLY